MGAPLPPYAAVEREVGLLLRRAASHARELARSVHPDLDAAAYVMLVRLDDAGGERVGELAAYFGVDKSVTSRQVSTLEALGLVRRDVDARDLRAQRVVLTGEGADRLHEVRARRREAYREMFADWSASDVQRLADDFARFNTLY